MKRWSLYLAGMAMLFMAGCSDTPGTSSSISGPVGLSADAVSVTPSCGEAVVVGSCALPGGNGTGIAFDGTYVYVGNHASNNYRQLDLDCELLCGPTALPGPAGNQDSRGMTFDGTHLWNTDFDCACAYSFAPCTSVRDASFPLPLPTGDASHLGGIAWDSDLGVFWHANHSGIIYMLSPTGAVIDSFLAGNAPHGIYYETPGVLWIVDQQADATWDLLKLDTAGNELCRTDLPPALIEPTGIEKIGDEFWLVDQKADKIWRVVLASEQIELDIKPGSCPNPLNPNSRRVLPVAILGTAGFDVHDIDVSSLLLEGVSPVGSKIQDVSRPVSDSDECACTARGPDGFEDLMLKFKRQDVASGLGTSSQGETLVLTITGNTLDGTPIQGTDCIVIVGNSRTRDRRNN